MRLAYTDWVCPACNRWTHYERPVRASICPTCRGDQDGSITPLRTTTSSQVDGEHRFFDRLMRDAVDVRDGC